MKALGEAYKFDIDIHEEVLESCAYHWWGLRRSPQRRIAIIIAGGGHPKNFSLQPEPTLSQIFLLPNINGYDWEVQFVSPTESNGALTACPPGEGHTWGKVALDALASRVISIECDYTQIIPWLIRGLIEQRQRFQRMLKELGPRKLFQRHPEARGFLRQTDPPRLFDRRDELMADLMARISRPAHLKRLKATGNFPLVRLA
jgi:deoxyhypusine synthase